MLHRVFPCLGLVALLAPLPLLSAEDKKPLPYPPARAEKLIEKVHGVDVADPYRWLEDAGSPDVKDWVEKQNKLTESVLGKVAGRKKIRERLGTLLEIGSIGTP